MPDAIVVDKLYKRFGTLQVLKGLSLSVPQGKTLIILGRSGVGKSVLLKHIIGITQADAGKIYVDGQCISHPMATDKRLAVLRKMGILFQGAALFDSMTIGENTAFYLRQHGDDQGRALPEEQIQERVHQALQHVGLEGTENKMPAELSGGMRKRAGLARVIIYHPSILLYDEPTTGLDPITADQINDLICSLRAQFSTTGIVVTHDIHSALKIGDFLALHHEGTITYCAPKEEFIQSKDPLVRAFLQHATVQVT